MAATRVVFSVDGVRDFLIEKGGRVSNTELAKQFRVYLLDPKEQDKNKVLFKQYITAVGSIKREGNEKYVVLKPGHEKIAAETEQTPSLSGRCSTQAKDKNGSEPLKETEYMEAKGQFVETPVVPPRRRHNDEDSRSLSPKEHSEDDIGRGSQSSNGNDENEDDDQVISVKERARKLNKMASETQLVLCPNAQNRRRERNDKANDDDDVSLIVLNSHTKEWIVKAASSDFAALSKLLKEDGRLARYKDFTSTALHWAAKHGKIEVVKLIANTPGANVNIRSGFTPLHLAAQFKRHDVYNLLKNCYSASTKIRDYSGRTAEDYVKTPAHRREQELARGHSVQKERKRDPVVPKDPGFLRLGSFNVKVRRTAESIGKSKSKMHKTWGSADSLPENADELLMPPPPNMIPWPKHHKQRKSCVISASRSGTQC